MRVRRFELLSTTNERGQPVENVVRPHSSLCVYSQLWIIGMWPTFFSLINWQTTRTRSAATVVALVALQLDRML
jgi:hypothetical protein